MLLNVGLNVVLNVSLYQKRKERKSSLLVSFGWGLIARTTFPTIVVVPCLKIPFEGVYFIDIKRTHGGNCTPECKNI